MAQILYGAWNLVYPVVNAERSTMGRPKPG